jgi:hypothetical protein
MALALLIVQQLMLVAAMALLGQFIVAIFNWGARQQNFVYQLLGKIALPATWLARKVTPRVVLDQHLPAVALFLLLVGYLAAGLWHRDVCLSNLQQAGCERWVEARLGGR